MGWAARANAAETRDTLEADIRMLIESFKTREDFEAHCVRADVTDEERIYLETLLPPHLRAAVTITHLDES